jgi:ferrous iron transport protein B
MLLSELNNKESGIIKKINGEGAFRKRISEMGFVKGQSVLVVKNAPLLDPVEYSIMGYAISLRRNEAALIEIEDALTNRVTPSFPGTFNISAAVKEKPKTDKTINIALVGNPNCGKTSIFNYASNSFEHVGNYGGVTVETKLARIEYRDYKFNIYDLPGTYSLNSYSPEELYVRNFIGGNSPDVVVNVVDATNLERNLYLTTQLIDMDQRVVIALNMFDELKIKGQHFNHL